MIWAHLINPPQDEISKRRGFERSYFFVPDEIFQAPVSGYAKLVYIFLHGNFSGSVECGESVECNKNSVPVAIDFNDLENKTGLSQGVLRVAVIELIEAGLAQIDSDDRFRRFPSFSNEGEANV